MKRLARGLVFLAVLIAIAAALGPAAIAWREPDDGRALPGGVPGRWVEVGGRRVHVVEMGEGSPLLLVHGFGASTYDFEERVMEPLARSHRAIALDLFGSGWSERSDDFRYGFALWADQLAGTLDALGIERASVAGHSMGGAVAAVFAARYPARVDRLILADALYPAEPGETPLVFRALWTPIVGELALGLVADASAPGFSTEHRDRALPWYRIRGTRRGFLRYVRDPSKRAELAAAYPEISAPTLILHGTEDESVPYAAMERSAPKIRHARIVPLPGGRHFLLRDAPDVFVREVDAFLAEP
ncbi:MAG TPA: alpha/beta hydrolase [Myxococcota bacterium]|jgi:pimeloyl-ACP methyl ester carboxylesterase|nr:alpha/beta hydrolase [Myxococcota bacterium]